MPVHCSASGAWVDPFALVAPTAMHAPAGWQDTPISGLNAFGLAVDCTDQVFPFQCSASALPDPASPTAVQFPLPGHVTPPSRPFRLVASTDQFLPFQCSARVAPLPRRPTARQSLAHVQEIP